MPIFTPDAERFRLGRPYLLWFVPQIDEPYILARDAAGEWWQLFTPTSEELSGYVATFDSGRETHVTYQQVRDWDLTSIGRVLYVDDFDDQYTDVYISRANTPYARASVAEPVWSEE